MTSLLSPFPFQGWLIPLGVREVLAGRFLILDAHLFVDVLYRGRKPQKGRRTALDIDYIIITSLSNCKRIVFLYSIFKIWRKKCKSCFWLKRWGLKSSVVHCSCYIQVKPWKSKRALLNMTWASECGECGKIRPSRFCIQQISLP